MKSTGEALQKAASEFSGNTLLSDKRAAMVGASKSLLMAVTRLMVVADAADVSKLFKASSQVYIQMTSSVRFISDSFL